MVGDDEEEDEITKLIGRRAQDHSAQEYSAESLRRGLNLAVRGSDVFIATAPKTGTTWLTQIVHQLRTSDMGGHMDFDDIYQVAPWPPLSWDLGIDCDADQIREPRLFKTHQRLSALPRGCRYLCAVRDPARTILSWWRFLGPSGKDVPPLRKYDTASAFVRDEDFVVGNMRFGASLWDYYVEFYECRKVDSVLVVVFEDLEEDLEALLPVLASFVGAPGDGLDGVAARCTRAFMRDHASKFDESWTYRRLVDVGRMGDPSSYVPSDRVRAATAATAAFDADAVAFLDRQWAERVAPRTGHATYAAFAAALPR